MKNTSLIVYSTKTCFSRWKDIVHSFNNILTDLVLVSRSVFSGPFGIIYFAIVLTKFLNFTTKWWKLYLLHLTACITEHMVTNWTSYTYLTRKRCHTLHCAWFNLTFLKRWCTPLPWSSWATDFIVHYSMTTDEQLLMCDSNRICLLSLMSNDPISMNNCAIFKAIITTSSRMQSESRS